MKFQAGETMHELKFTVNSVADLEELTGKSLGDVFQAGEFSAMRSLIWCGLTHSDPKLTMHGAGDILDAYISEGGGIDQAFTLINEALTQAGFLRAQTARKKAK